MNTVEKLLAPLVGQYTWGTTWDSQLGLRMSFGNPYLRIIEPLRLHPNNRIVVPRGQWWLWVYFAKWRISLEDARAAKGGTSRSRSSVKRIYRATTCLDGQIVTGVEVMPKTGALVLSFDLGGQLKIQPLGRKKNDEMWLLYQKEGDPVLAIRSGGTFSYIESSKKEV